MFPFCSRQHGRAVEHGLLYDKHQCCRNKEEPVCESSVVWDVLFIRHCLYQLDSTLAAYAHGRETLYLYVVHLTEHYVIDCHQQILVVEETAHVRIGGDTGLSPAGDGVSVVLREKHDAVDPSLPHESGGLLHVRASVSYAYLSGCVHFSDKPSAFGTVREIHDSHRCIVHSTVAVDYSVYQRISQSSQEKDDHHPAVTEYHAQLIGEYVVPVPAPLSEISYHVSFWDNSIF